MLKQLYINYYFTMNEGLPLKTLEILLDIRLISNKNKAYESRCQIIENSIFDRVKFIRNCKSVYEQFENTTERNYYYHNILRCHEEILSMLLDDAMRYINEFNNNSIR
jgi:hypothetical protein